MQFALMGASTLLVGLFLYQWTGDLLLTVVGAIYVVGGWILAKSRSWLFDVDDTNRRDWWIGRTGKADYLASLVYLLGVILPLVWFVADQKVCPALTKGGSRRVAVLAYGAIVSVGPHVWLWLESSAFFAWSARKYERDPDRLKEQRERFKLNADGAKAIWAAVIALYAGVLLKFGCS